ncbi:MAG: hypothetical protein WEE36_06400 [Acidimicrobiia bacterium]
MNDTSGNELWELVGPSERFKKAALPMSGEANRLFGGAFRHILYAEFDTDLEPDSWHDFVFDPIRVLMAENIIGPTPLDDHHSNLHVTIYKLTGTDPEDPDYVAEVTRRGELSARMCRSTEVAEESRRAWHLSTTVINHEQPLNPRIGLATVLM